MLPQLRLFIFALGLAVIQFPFAVEAQTSLDSLIKANVLSGTAQRLGLRGHGYEPATMDSLLQDVYREHKFHPLWVSSSGLLSGAQQVRQVIEESADDGLFPEEYFLDQIRTRWDTRNSKVLAELDLILTLAAAKLVADISTGRADLRQLESVVFGEKTEKLNLSEVVRGALSNPNSIASVVRSRYPRHSRYTSLKSALAFYRRIEKNGGWKTLKGNPPLAPGWEVPEMIELARHLKTTGDMPPKQAVTEVFDPAIEAAVKNFQYRHGLDLTGWADIDTLPALNVPIAARIRTLTINLERWRRLPREFTEEKQVFVNIAGYELLAYAGPRQVLRLPAVVGEKYTATPLFTNAIRYIEMNPYWNVPPSIAADEILPYLRQDPAYARNQHMQIFERSGKSMREVSAFDVNWKRVSEAQMNRYSVRQIPGKWNTLGSLKFVFPNQFNVYLHETGNPELLSELERAFSHGCVRLSNAQQLAAFLLDSPRDGWNAQRVERMVANGKNQNVILPKPVPIHMIYQTAWVDPDQSIHFRADIYDRDRALERVMFRSSLPKPRKTGLDF